MGHLVNKKQEERKMKTITVSKVNNTLYITIRGILGQQATDRRALNMSTGEWECGERITGKNNPNYGAEGHYGCYHHGAVNADPICTIGGVKEESYIETAKLALSLDVHGYTTRRNLLEGKTTALLPPVNSFFA